MNNNNNANISAGEFLLNMTVKLFIFLYHTGNKKSGQHHIRTYTSYNHQYKHNASHRFVQIHKHPLSNNKKKEHETENFHKQIKLSE